MQVCPHRMSSVFCLIGIIGLSIVLPACCTPQNLPQVQIDEAEKAFKMAEKAGARLLLPEKWKAASSKSSEMQAERIAQQSSSCPSYTRTAKLAGELKLLAEAVKGETGEVLKQQLQSSNFMSDPLTTKLVLYQNRLRPPSDLMAEHREIQRFVDLGIVTVQPYTVILGKSFGSKVVLTQTGERAAASGWRRKIDEKDEAWRVIMAHKELTNVSEPTISENSGDCVVTWKWAPTRIGKDFGVTSDEVTSHVRFRSENNRLFFEPIT